ncbi:hypothetical protein BGZ95_009331 [Linnemannia exigua]|uniref:Uncharacterized protein n=1 Tax=Linnemannia exigua TaxID=604196 RepID=A0AAD4DDB9_9FUNG|nr:hypothetical protein BGZ95_009331 [Linnemannia exigua]
MNFDSVINKFVVPTMNEAQAPAPPAVGGNYFCPPANRLYSPTAGRSNSHSNRSHPTRLRKRNSLVPARTRAVDSSAAQMKDAKKVHRYAGSGARDEYNYRDVENLSLWLGSEVEARYQQKKNPPKAKSPAKGNRRHRSEPYDLQVSPEKKTKKTAVSIALRLGPDASLTVPYCKNCPHDNLNK